jgi:hypothetical protein
LRIANLLTRPARIPYYVYLTQGLGFCQFTELYHWLGTFKVPDQCSTRLSNTHQLSCGCQELLQLTVERLALMGVVRDR